MTELNNAAGQMCNTGAAQREKSLDNYAAR